MTEIPGVSIPDFNDYGVQKVQVEPRHGSKLEIFSQNFCDKRTWFTTSTRETGVALTDSGDGLTWNQPTPGVFVDLKHGRVADEAAIAATYHPVVYIDGVPATEHSPDSYYSYDANKAEAVDGANGDGDYFMDYTTGAVTFKTSQAGNTITVDQSRVVDSKWYITPAAGKRIELMMAELQMNVGSIMRSDFVFQPRALVERHPLTQAVWDDATNPAKTVLSATYTWNGTTTVICTDTSEISVGEYVSLDGSGAYYYVVAVTTDVSITIADVLNIGVIPTGATPTAKSPVALFPTGTKLPLGDPSRYKTKFDLIAESLGSYPLLPGDPKDPGLTDGWSWRQNLYDCEIFRWDYKEQAYIDIRDDYGMDVEISLSDDVPAAGWKAVVTFYGISKDDESQV